MLHFYACGIHSFLSLLLRPIVAEMKIIKSAFNVKDVIILVESLLIVMFFYVGVNLYYSAGYKNDRYMGYPYQPNELVTITSMHAGNQSN